MTVYRKNIAFFYTALGASLLPLVGVAQTPTTGDRPLLEELIVTAQKREQNLQDVAVGVSLLSGKAMRNAQIKNAAELATLIPTLNVQASSGPSTSSFNIRGIGTQAFSPAVDPSVSTMLDGVVMGRSGMAFLDLVDVERVEVLRGPQGTLYGKNASGGVVHIITKDPTPELSGTAAATAIQDDEYRIDGSVAGLITNDLGFRLTGSGVHDDGYAENVYNGDKINGTESYNVRGKLLWQANEDLEFMLSSDYSKSDCDCTALSVRSILAGPDQQNLLEQQLPVVPSKKNQNVNNDQPTFTNLRSSGVSLTTNWELNNYGLTSITAYRDWQSEGIVDFDDGPTNPLALSFPSPPKTDQNQFSQEFRIASPPADWGSYIVGAFYFEQDINTSNATTTSLLEPLVPATTRTSKTDVTGKNVAVFGEVNFNLWQDWQLILGGRYTYDELEYDTSADKTDNLIFPPAGDFSDSLDDSDISPKIAIQWDMNDDAMVYASYVGGYKGPAFDTSLIAGGSYVKPETSDAWETGFKSRWLDNRLIVNFAAFYAKYKNFQAQASVDDPDDLLPASLVLVNAGKVSTQGIELEVIAQPSVDWMITGGVAYTDATIDDYPEGNCSGGQKYRGECPLGFQNLSGGQLPYTPKWKLNLSTNYTIQLDDLPFNVVFGGNLRSQDDVLYGLSQDENTKQEAYTIVDIRATLAGTRDGYRVTAFVKNIFDTNYASLIYANSEVLLPNGYIQYVPKYANRTAGIEVRYDF